MLNSSGSQNGYVRRQGAAMFGVGRSRGTGKSSGVVRVAFFGILLLLALIYALPNFFGDDWAIQLTAKEGSSASRSELIERAQLALSEQKISIMQPNRLLAGRDERGASKRDGEQLAASSDSDNGNSDVNNDRGSSVLLRFQSNEQQLAAKEVLQNAMPDCTVTLSLAARAPSWLQAIGAKPMRLGLDLRGGVHLLLAIDFASYWPQFYKQQTVAITDYLSDQRIAFSVVPNVPVENGIQLVFASKKEADRASTLLAKQFADYQIEQSEGGIERNKNSDAGNGSSTSGIDKTLNADAAGARILQLLLGEEAKERLRERVLEQTMQVVQNRVNELGVSEAVVQRQSHDHISVDLPGVQDIARAKELLGKTATLRFQLVADVAGNDLVAQDGYEVYHYHGHQVALQPEIALDGSAITYATAGGDQWGRPAVHVELSADAADDFHRVTAANVGKALAVVYSQMNRVCRYHHGQQHCFNLPDERLISVATIRSALGSRFEISGLTSERTAEDLALLLRSGALSAPVSVVHEVTVGPSMGAANIERGAWSLVVGLALVAVFMVAYYGWFGVIADLTLLFNLVFMVATLSVLDATLTMAGMAGMVLTVGMAVDASVLILERIREELKAGYGGHMAIQIGYQRALATILDSNLSTFIISAVLFSLGSGAVKGFAVTLTVGLLTSMLTAVVYSKLMTEQVFECYGRVHWGRNLPIGIRLKALKALNLQQKNEGIDNVVTKI